jgi:hypothetical protein
LGVIGKTRADGVKNMDAGIMIIQTKQPVEQLDVNGMIHGVWKWGAGSMVIMQHVFLIHLKAVNGKHQNQAAGARK